MIAALLLALTTDPLYQYQWGLAQIRVPDAWAVTTGSQAVRVALVDSGLTPQPDLTGNVLEGHSVVGGDTLDPIWHGTWMASVIGADTGNGIGMAGVCWQVGLVPIKTASTQASYAKGLAWAATHADARVALVSAPAWSFETQAFNVALRRAWNKGVLVVCPSGSSPEVVEWTNDPRLLAVGAVDEYGVRYPTSLCGGMLDLVASACSVVPWQGDYTTTCGTSIAAGFVAGVAALVCSVAPGLEPWELRDILFATAQDLGAPGWDPEYGWGEVDAGAAVMAAWEAR